MFEKLASLNKFFLTQIFFSIYQKNQISSVDFVVQIHANIFTSRHLHLGINEGPSVTLHLERKKEIIFII
jgi:hypothetical protein